MHGGRPRGHFVHNSTELVPSAVGAVIYVLPR